MFLTRQMLCLRTADTHKAFRRKADLTVREPVDMFTSRRRAQNARHQNRRLGLGQLNNTNSALHYDGLELSAALVRHVLRSLIEAEASTGQVGVHACAHV